MKAVKVRWIDSCASNMNWLFPADIEGEVQPVHIITYGVVVQDNEDTIVIAQNYGSDPEQFCSLMTIPKGCIKELVTIEDNIHF